MFPHPDIDLGWHCHFHSGGKLNYPLYGKLVRHPTRMQPTLPNRQKV